MKNSKFPFFFVCVGLFCFFGGGFFLNFFWVFEFPRGSFHWQNIPVNTKKNNFGDKHELIYAIIVQIHLKTSIHNDSISLAEGQQSKARNNKQHTSPIDHVASSLGNIGLGVNKGVEGSSVEASGPRGLGQGPVGDAGGPRSGHGRCGRFSARWARGGSGGARRRAGMAMSYELAVILGRPSAQRCR